MKQIARERLVAALCAHGIHFLADGDGVPANLAPSEMIGGLAAHTDPRLRASLTVVFLVHPEWATWVPGALEQLDRAAATELQARYMAAVYLQRLWRTRLHFHLGQAALLPDFFSRDLGLPSADERFGKTGLVALAKWHARRSVFPYNRLASYHHSAALLFGQLCAEARSNEFTTTD